MSLIYDDNHFEYPGLHGSTSFCRLRVFELVGNCVVVATELIKPSGGYLCDGTSITNGAESLVTKVKAVLGEWCLPNLTHFIEHYPDRGWELDVRKKKNRPPETPETIDLVIFEWDKLRRRYIRPRWKSIGRAGLIALTQEQLDDEYYDQEKGCYLKPGKENLEHI